MTLISGQQNGSAVLRAAQWIESLLLGPLVVSIAIIAIAAIGYSMLSGRISARRGLTVVLGCFVVFGAPAIALGIASATSKVAGERYLDPPIDVVRSEPQFSPPLPSPSPANADPYAGASVGR